MSARSRKSGVPKALSFRNFTAAACRSRGTGVKITPGWLPDFCCDENPPTMGTT